MKSVNALSGLRRAPLRDPANEDWRARSGRLFSEFERQARAMVRRAFRGAFSDHEIDDIYANAWTGTLRALAGRHREMADDEIRSYLLTAVANQASRELRRRKRKPTAPLELVAEAIPDDRDAPDLRAESAEQSQIARDLLTSLPPRRRAVMLLRYGWGLEPKQVCALVTGLSPRAYRKEITKGVDQFTQRMRALETGEWCLEREPILKSFAAGLADGDEARQAKAHLAHCRECSQFVARLRGHLHDFGSSVVLADAIDGIDAKFSIGERMADIGDRVRDAAGGLAGRGGVDELGPSVVASGGAKGAGAAGAGVLAKIAGLGTAGKLAVACLGGGVAATACVAAGIGPIGSSGAEQDDQARVRDGAPASERSIEVEATPVAPTLPSQLEAELTPPPAPAATAPEPEQQPDPQRQQVEAAVQPLAETAPAVQQEFTPDSAAAPVSGSSADVNDSNGASAGTVREEFTP